MSSIRPPHLWLALSPHGYGHAVMTAPVIAAVRRRRPDLRLTIQTTLPRDFLVTRYGEDFDHVAVIDDFGLRMISATEVDVEGSAAGYRALHADWPGLVEREARRLAAAAPDLVVSNVAHVPLAAAGRAGLPAMAVSSLNWADIYRRYLGDRPEAGRIIAEMVAAYGVADPFLRALPAMEMPGLVTVRDIGPIARVPIDRSAELRRTLGVGPGMRVGLISFGGIDHDLDLSLWPRLDGWIWLSSLAVPSGRDDLRPWSEAGIAYADLTGSVAVIVTKIGYGTFTEAAMASIPVLFLSRPGWPETPALDDWLCRHDRALPTSLETLLGGGLAEQLRLLFSLPVPPSPAPSGIEEAAGIIIDRLTRSLVNRGCS
jgi:hypothetical protein